MIALVLAVRSTSTRRLRAVIDLASLTTTFIRSRCVDCAEGLLSRLYVVEDEDEQGLFDKNRSSRLIPTEPVKCDNNLKWTSSKPWETSFRIAYHRNIDHEEVRWDID